MSAALGISDLGIKICIFSTIWKELILKNHLMRRLLTSACVYMALGAFKFQTIADGELIDGVRFYVLENSRAKRQSFAYFEDKGIIY